MNSFHIMCTRDNVLMVFLTACCARQQPLGVAIGVTISITISITIGIAVGVTSGITISVAVGDSYGKLSRHYIAAPPGSHDSR